MKSSKKHKKVEKPKGIVFSKHGYVLGMKSDKDIIIEENDDFEEVNMTKALEKLLNTKPIKKKKNECN